MSQAAPHYPYPSWTSSWPGPALLHGTSPTSTRREPSRTGALEASAQGLATNSDPLKKGPWPNPKSRCREVCSLHPLRSGQGCGCRRWGHQELTPISYWNLDFNPFWTQWRCGSRGTEILLVTLSRRDCRRQGLDRERPLAVHPLGTPNLTLVSDRGMKSRDEFEKPLILPNAVSQSQVFSDK